MRRKTGSDLKHLLKRKVIRERPPFCKMRQREKREQVKTANDLTQN